MQLFFLQCCHFNKCSRTKIFWMCPFPFISRAERIWKYDKMAKMKTSFLRWTEADKHFTTLQKIKGTYRNPSKWNLWASLSAVFNLDNKTDQTWSLWILKKMLQSIHCLQLICGRAKEAGPGHLSPQQHSPALPGGPQAVSGQSSGSPLSGIFKKTSKGMHPGGILIRHLNHLSWLLSMWRRSGSNPSSHPDDDAPHL